MGIPRRRQTTQLLLISFLAVVYFSHALSNLARRRVSNRLNGLHPLFHGKQAPRNQNKLKANEADDHSMRKNVELYDKYGSLSAVATDILSSSNTNKNSLFGVDDGSPSTRENNGNFPDLSPTYSRKYGAKPEVLSPAGGWPQLRAAVANGANACYFGLQEGFNARARASNFAIDELSTVMDFLHERGVKGYLVINILVFDEEMEKLEKLVRRVAASGVDALIMQDLGAVEFVRTIAPNLPIHGSTQMTITDANGARFTKRLGVERVVVGRELSVEEIASVGKGSNVEIEAFVHGALCVSYSGQCFSSEAWGGRSANRGQCAQACRMPYGLIVNGTLVELLDDVKYLLSPQDLMAIDYVPELVVAGVKSFKIEGRLKGPEYVAITTRAYRLAVDEAWRNLHLDSETDTAEGVKNGGLHELTMKMHGASLSSPTAVTTTSSPRFNGLDEELMRDLRQVFSRGQDEVYDGLSAGFLNGVKHQDLVRGRSPRHRGLFVGTVVTKSPKGVVVQLKGPIKRGDGIVLDRGNPEEQEEGGAVYEVLDSRGRPIPKGEEVESGIVTISFGRNAVDYSRINPGDIIWRNKDPALDSRMKSYMNRGDTQILDVYIKVTGTVGQPLEILISSTPFREQKKQFEMQDTENEKKEILESKGSKSADIIPYYLREKEQLIGRASTESVCVAATSKPIGAKEIIAAVGTLGDSPFRIHSSTGDWDTSSGDLSVCTEELHDGLFVPVSEIKAARRKALAMLVEATKLHEKDKGMSRTSVLPSLRAEAKMFAEQGVLNPKDLTEEFGTTVTPAVVTIIKSESKSQVAEEKVEVKSAVKGKNARLLGRIRKSKDLSMSLEDIMEEEEKNVLNKAEQKDGIVRESPVQGSGTNGRIDSIQIPHTPVSSDVGASLSVLCRTPLQVTAACGIPYITEITLDFLEVHGLREAVQEIKKANKIAVVATPRIIKPNEERLYTFYLRLKADALLVRSAGFLNQLLELGGAGAVLCNSNITIPDLRGDFSLNAANAISAGVLLRTGISRLAPTHDLNSQQIMDMVSILGPAGAKKIEVVIHQHLAVFHTEHCVFCRFLSDGSSFKDCGHPCETNTVSLRGFDGQDHLVLADMGCRNTVFSAQAQSGAIYLKDFMASGINHFRIEFVDEKPEDVVKVISMYQDVCKNIVEIQKESRITQNSHSGDSETRSYSNNNNFNNNAKTIGDRNLESSLNSLWKFLEIVPNGYGLPQGVSLGSLKPTLERNWDSLKPTAKR